MGRFINPFTDVGFKRIFGQDIFHELPDAGAGRTQVTDGRGAGRPGDREAVLEQNAAYLPGAARLHEGRK